MDSPAQHGENPVEGAYGDVEEGPISVEEVVDVLMVVHPALSAEVLACVRGGRPWKRVSLRFLSQALNTCSLLIALNQRTRPL